MKNESRTTDPSPGHHQDVTWPSSAQALRQLGVIALVVVLWGVLLAGYLLVTSGSGSEPLAALPEPTRSATAPADTLPPPTEAVVAPADTPPSPTEAVDTPAAESEMPPTEAPSSPSTASFSGDVFPILERRCVQCHGPSRTSGGVRLDSRDAVMTVVVPGDAAVSLLVEVVVTGNMPRRGPKLLSSEIEAISAWVNAGAPDN